MQKLNSWAENVLRGTQFLNSQCVYVPLTLDFVSGSAHWILGSKLKPKWILAAQNLPNPYLIALGDRPTILLFRKLILRVNFGCVVVGCASLAILQTAPSSLKDNQQTLYSPPSRNM